MTGFLSEESGKISFGRVFGAFVLVSTLCGWWFDGFHLGGFDLPDSTVNYVLIGLLPYISGKAFSTISAVLKPRT